MQRLIGNQATQRLMIRSGAGRQMLQRSPTGVQFAQFLNEGTGMVGRQLGHVDVGTFMMNGVEFQFSVTEKAQHEYRQLRPRQWAGPEAVWVKYGNPLTARWEQVSRNNGRGRDDPEQESIVTRADRVAYFDSPGPNLTGHAAHRPPSSRIYVAQNFTGWIEGEPSRGGPAERLCDVVAWHSIVSLANMNWNNNSQDAGTANYQRIHPNVTRLGWTDVATPPST
ncbi:MAG: hypothetical protein HC794_03125 [Nitrospiraceae bacterium]|nr:hypothetical protein [Nitrospiraceae bacterium]